MDPTGTVGGRQTGDMDLALDGGPRFDDRLRELAKAKDDAARALKELRLGKDTVAALRDAQAQREAAGQLRANADQVMVSAQNEAAKIVAGAKATAASLEKAAKDVADVAAAKALSVRDSAEDLFQRASAKAKEVEAAAAAKMSAAQSLFEQAKAELAKHFTLSSAATQAKQDADSTKAQYQDKLDKLQGVLRDLTED